MQPNKPASAGKPHCFLRPELAWVQNAQKLVPLTGLLHSRAGERSLRHGGRSEGDAAPRPASGRGLRHRRAAHAHRQPHLARRSVSRHGRGPPPPGAEGKRRASSCRLPGGGSHRGEGKRRAVRDVSSPGPPPQPGARPLNRRCASLGWPGGGAHAHSGGGPARGWVGGGAPSRSRPRPGPNPAPGSD